MGLKYRRTVEGRQIYERNKGKKEKRKEIRDLGTKEVVIRCISTGRSPIKLNIFQVIT
jgi:hypothetical protein